jgi:hypothetical protein
MCICAFSNIFWGFFIFVSSSFIHPAVLHLLARAAALHQARLFHCHRLVLQSWALPSVSFEAVRLSVCVQALSSQAKVSTHDHTAREK